MMSGQYKEALEVLDSTMAGINSDICRRERLIGELEQSINKEKSGIADCKIRIRNLMHAIDQLRAAQGRI